MNKKRLILLILVNTALVIAIVFSIASLSAQSKERSFSQNIENIRTLTDASSNKVELLFSTYSESVRCVASYVNYYDGVGMTEEALADYLTAYYDTSRYNWQIVDSVYRGSPEPYDRRGYYSRKAGSPDLESRNYNPLEYPNLAPLFYGASEETLGTVTYTKEFTDVFGLVKSFAVGACIRLRTDGGFVYKTLMLVLPSETISAIIAVNNTTDNHQFFDYTDIIVDQSGDYVISSPYFQGVNFLEYIALYNERMSDAEKDAILEGLARGSAQEQLFYKNNRGEGCVYTLAPVRGTEWYMLSLVPIGSFHNTRTVSFGYYIFFTAFALLFLTDILYVMSINRKLLVKTREAEEASRAKGSFMSRMSHEIRTPLNAIIGYNMIAQNEMSDAKNDAERRQAEMKTLDCLAKSGIASKHLLTVVNDVLDMSAIESGKIKVAHERFDFKGLITSLTTIFYSQANAKNVKLDVILGKLTEEWFTGDQLRVNQVLTNLLSNAIKFTPDGGQVKLTITETEVGPSSTHVHFTVEDTGIGMTEEYLSHLWAPFEQADSTISRRFGGSGLGLSITKSLVELMHGRIAVESKVGVGTKFDVDLDFERAMQPNQASYDFSDVKALIVDDDSSTCDYVKLLFERCGVRSDAVRSGYEAVECYTRSMENDPYTICLVDWRMPKMDGLETIRRLREVAGSHVPIIVITAYDYSEIADKIAEIGITQFVAKPLFQSSVLDLLANVCNKKPQTQAASAARKSIFNGERILLVEDNAMNMEIAKNIVRRAGLTVDTAWNGQEAIDRFESSAEGTYKLILMDVHMPDVDGYKATKTIRASAHPDAASIPIIAMTADAFAEDVAEALACGMNGHIAKPINVSVLLGTLAKHIYR